MMSDTVTNFLKLGRHFRVNLSRGDVVLIEPDETMNGFIKKWAQSLGASVVSFQNIRQVEKFEASPRCVIVGLEGCSIFELKKFLSVIDREHPVTVTVVYSSNKAVITEIQNLLPRVTTILKGEGLKHLLFSLDAEMRVEGIVA